MIRPAPRLGLLAAALLALVPQSRAQEDAGTAIPEALRPFEHLIGPWKGTAIPTANRLRGWPERATWAWTFRDGRPDGLSVTFEGNKQLASGRLNHDPASGRYRLDASDPEGKPVAYAGTLDARGQTLTLDRDPAPDQPAQRLVLRLNSNRIRYTVRVEEKAPRATQYSRVLEANLGKEGEAFAATSAAESLPRCILTGGAATLSVTYNGRSYPVCCTGCRDEFLADPEKYIQKAAARAGK